MYMKRVAVVMMALCLLVCSIPFAAYAMPEENVVIEYLADGGYIVTRVADSMTRIANTKSRELTKAKYDDGGNLDWQIVFTATFTYDGVTARCTSTDLDVTIYDSSWYQISAYHNRGAAQGYANVQLGRKVLGVTVEKPSYYLSLNCTPDGNIS